VARKLGHYVYLYVNPLDGRVFYVGKGKGSRAIAHLHAPEDREISSVIRQIHAAGAKPRIELLAHGLPSADVALHVEAAAIDLLGLESLANAVRGRGVRFGRRPLDEVTAHYVRRRAMIREPSILIRIPGNYRYGMSDVELYDATRSAWRLGERRVAAQLAIAVFEGVVREVYRITGWFPGGTTFSVRRGGKYAAESERWEFVGTLADDAVRRRYIQKYVGHLFPPGAQNPIAYLNLGSEKRALRGPRR
jgi:hypothetical protein